MNFYCPQFISNSCWIDLTALGSYNKKEAETAAEMYSIETGKECRVVEKSKNWVFGFKS